MDRNHIRIDIEEEFKKLRCVYRVVFDNSHFYIGSTKDLNVRLQLFNGIFNPKPNAKHSKYLVEVANKCKCVYAQVIEVVSDEIDPKVIEDKYLKICSDHPLLLNRSKSAFSNKGIKWTEEQRKSLSIALKGIKKSELRRRRIILDQIKKQPRIVVPRPKKIRVLKGHKRPEGYIHAGSKPVLKLNKEGVILERYQSIGSAARCNKVHESSIKKNIRGYTKTLKGFVFKFESDTCEKYLRPTKEKKSGRDVILIDKYGIEVAVFKRHTDAAKYLEKNVSSIERALSGEQKTVKEFTIKYGADRRPVEKNTTQVPNTQRYIIDISTGVFYYSVRELSRLLNVKDRWLYDRLTGDIVNNTQYRYA